MNEIYSIDYLIGEEAQLGKGFGTVIMGLLTEAVFQKNNSKRIIVQPELENQASCGALRSYDHHFDKANSCYIKNRS